MPTRLVRQTVTLAVVVAVALAGLATVVGTSAPASASTGDRVGFSPGSMILWGSDAELARDLDAMVATGASWLRLDFDWPSAEPSPGQFNWSHIDRVVVAAQARGLKILALPTYTPAWARPAGTNDKYPPSNPATFATFVTAAVARYAARGVKAWELWNEPNLASFWSPRPDPDAYARLLIPAAAAVRAVDPTATVLSGGLAPAVDAADGTQVSPLTFLGRAYDAGAKGSFDAVAIHPYSYPALPTQPGTESWNTFLRMPLVHNLMVERGDGAKQIWATEFGAPTGTARGAVTEDVQAQIATDAIQAMAQWPWAGPIFWYALRDYGTNAGDREQNFGLLRKDFTPKKSLAAFTAAVGGPSTAPTSPTTAPVVSSPAVKLSGSDRIGTAIEVSRRKTAAASVVVATTRSFADALVGGPLAVKMGGPVLLTGPEGLDPRVGEEIQRLGATSATVLGGPAALSDRVVEDLAARGVSTTRIAGADRYETAAMVATAIAPSDIVVVASGERFADALSAGALGLPIVLTGRDTLPDAARAALGTATPVVVGGPAAVALNVLPDALRLFGGDRFATSATIADWGISAGLYPNPGVVVTRGDDYADALVGGTLGMPLLLVARDGLGGSPATRDWLVAHAPVEPAMVLGGTSALLPETQAELDRAFAGVH